MRDIEFWALLLLCVLVTAGIMFGPSLVPVQAAAKPTVPPCEEINKAGLIVIWRCIPDQGYPYLVNSAGFMLPEE